MSKFEKRKKQCSVLTCRSYNYSYRTVLSTILGNSDWHQNYSFLLQVMLLDFNQWWCSLSADETTVGCSKVWDGSGKWHCCTYTL